MMRVDDPPPRCSTLLVNVVRGRKIHHELAFQINAFASESAVGDVVQVPGPDESSERHFSWRKCFPTATAGV